MASLLSAERTAPIGGLPPRSSVPGCSSSHTSPTAERSMRTWHIPRYRMPVLFYQKFASGADRATGSIRQTLSGIFHRPNRVAAYSEDWIGTRTDAVYTGKVCSGGNLLELPARKKENRRSAIPVRKLPRWSQIIFCFCSAHKMLDKRTSWCCYVVNFKSQMRLSKTSSLKEDCREMPGGARHESGVR